MLKLACCWWCAHFVLRVLLWLVVQDGRTQYTVPAKEVLETYSIKAISQSLL